MADQPRVADYTELPMLPRNNCYQNARIMAHHPDLRYVEGVVILVDNITGEDVLSATGDLMTMEHAWNETAAGTVVENTIRPDPESPFHWRYVEDWSAKDKFLASAAQRDASSKGASAT